MTERNEPHVLSFLGLLVGGVLIVVGGLMGALMMGAWGAMGMMPMADAMAGYVDAGSLAAMAWWMALVGVATGGLVLLAAAQVYRRRDPALWGAVGIAAGALSLFAMGGYVVGAVAAIAGGALALVERRQASRAGASEGPPT